MKITDSDIVDASSPTFAPYKKEVDVDIDDPYEASSPFLKPFIYFG